MNGIEEFIQLTQEYYEVKPLESYDFNFNENLINLEHVENIYICMHISTTF